MNIDEIAKLSGVSRSTVSRVLNGLPGVRPQIREHVMAVVSEQKRQSAAPPLSRTFLSGNNQVFGLVLHQNFTKLFGDNVYAFTLQGIQHASLQRGFEMFMWMNEGSEQQFFERIVRRRMVDGVLILEAFQTGNWLIEQLVRLRFPCVVIGRPDVEGASYVDVDNRLAARQAVDHLIRTGRKRIGIITGLADMTASSDRLAGYEDALRAAGLSIDPALIAEGYFTQDGAYSATGFLLQAKPDGIFVTSDTMAMGVLRRLNLESIVVPDTIAVVSYDDLPFAATCSPTLTTIHQPLEVMGRVAAGLLMDMVQQHDPSPRRILLPTQLVTRESCGMIGKGLVPRSKLTN